MRLKARIVRVILYRITILAFVWIVSGCGAKSVKLPTYMRPELLYLSGRPYSRLYVEIDAVEGVEVPDQWLDTLKEFLSTHCSKPDGIEIVCDKPIPFDDIKDMPIGPASILCLDGPDPNSGPQPAYLHVFFYDKDKIFKKTRKEPHVFFPCTSTIFYNVDYGYRLDKMIKFTLPHEAGHVLGLCKNTEHSDGVHCTNKECLMRPGPDSLPSLGLLLFGIPLKSELCDDCLSDLEAYKSESANPDLTFDGPFLIREEDGYSVASLPYCDLIIPIPADNTLDWTGLLSFLKDKIRGERRAALKTKRKSSRRLWYIRGFWNGSPDKSASSRSVTDDVDVFLRKAANDPCPFVRTYAITALKKFEQEPDP